MQLIKINPKKAAELIDVRSTYVVQWNGSKSAGKFSNEWYGLTYLGHPNYWSGIELESLLEEGAKIWRLTP